MTGLKRETMDKDGFKKALTDAGFSCSMKNGIPTVHASDKKVVSAVKKLAKELSYTESFGIVFDGGASLDGSDDVDEPAADMEVTEVLEESDGQTATEEPVNTESEPIEEVSESNLHSQPSLFDDFEDFDFVCEKDRTSCRGTSKDGALLEVTPKVDN